MVYSPVLERIDSPAAARDFFSSRISAKALGCVAMHEDGGTDTDNAEIINDFWASSDADHLALDLGCNRYGIKSALDTGTTEGRSVYCGGHHFARGENIANGGGFVNTESALPIMLKYRGAGWTFHGVNFYGWYAPNDGALIAATADRAEIAIEVSGQHSSPFTFPVGKANFVGGLGISSVVDGIVTIPTPVEDNADQFFIDRFFPHYITDNAIKLGNKQSVGFQILYADLYKVPTAFRFERAGKLRCHVALQQDGVDDLILIDGTDTNVGPDQSPIEIGSYYLDGSAPADCFALRSLQGNAMHTIFHNANVINSRATAGTPEPLFHASPYQKVDIRGGQNFYPGMLSVTEGSTEFWSTWWIQNAWFKVGSDIYDGGATPIKLFQDSSSGPVNVCMRGCVEVHNNTLSGPTPFNDGEFYADYQGKFSLS